MSYVRIGNKMDEINNSLNKCIHKDSNKKYKSLSGVVERNPGLNFKRLKTDEKDSGEIISHDTEQLNSAFIEELNEDCDGPLKSPVDENHIPTMQSYLEAKMRRPRKNKESLCIKENGAIPQTTSKVKGKRNLKAKHNPTSSDSVKLTTTDCQYIALKMEEAHNLAPEEVNIGFVEENEKNISKTRQGERRRKQRRWSGIFKRDLNIGFIEENTINDEESLMNQEMVTGDILEQVLTPESKHTIFESAEKICTEADKTPIRRKLRNKPKKQLTEQEIIKYYTDKTVKTKQNTLETIFETAKPEFMSVRKYRRFINFNERMSNVKVKKRHVRIRKYDLWENTQPLSMEYFLQKLEEVERDL